MPVPQSQFRYGLTVCSEVLYTLSGPYKSRVVTQWIEYHRLIGVAHFVIYDRDGSLAIDGVLEPYIKTGYVSYFPRFPEWALSRQHGIVHEEHGMPSHAAPDAHAATHCLYSQRGLAEWVAFLHSPDEYLSSSRGLRDVESELLRPLRPLRSQGVAALDVSSLYFTRGSNHRPLRESPWLLGRYEYRAEVPIELPRWGSNVAAFLNRFGSPIVNPHLVRELVSAHYPRVDSNLVVLDDPPQDFVRVNHYGETFKVRWVCDNDHVYDTSIFWAEVHLAARRVPALPPGPDPEPWWATVPPPDGPQ